MNDRDPLTAHPFTEGAADRFFSDLATRMGVVEDDCGDAAINASLFGMEPIKQGTHLTSGKSRRA